MSSDRPKIGIGLARMHPQDMLTLAREADEAGIHAITVGDSSYDSLSVLSAMSVVTRRIKLVTNVATWTRTPVTLARACRSLDYLSDGRFILGLGSMPARWNEEHHGISGEAMLSRMREYVELVRILWEATPDAPVDYAGRFYSVSGYRVHEPPPRPSIPIYIGASRRRMIRETGMWADGILFNWNFTIPWFKETAFPALDEGIRRAGRSMDDLELVAGRQVCVADSREEAEQARAAFRRHVARSYFAVDYHQQILTSLGFGEEVVAGAAAMARGDRDGAINAVSDRMVDEFTIIGTPDECRQRASDYTPMLSWFWLSPSAEGLSRSDRLRAARRVIETFGDAQ